MIEFHLFCRLRSRYDLAGWQGTLYLEVDERRQLLILGRRRRRPNIFRRRNTGRGLQLRLLIHWCAFPYRNRYPKLHKTQCQLYKRLTWPNIAHSASSLIWNWVSLMEVITMVQSTTTFLCIRPFWAWWHPTQRTTNQPGDPCASLLLTCDKAVFCNNHYGIC